MPQLLSKPLVIPTCGGQVIIDAERKNGHLLLRVELPPDIEDSLAKPEPKP